MEARSNIDWAVLLGDWDHPSNYMHYLNDYLKAVLPHLALQEQLKTAGRTNNYEELSQAVQEASLVGASVLNTVTGLPQGEVVQLVNLSIPQDPQGSPSKE